jgi:hypothetical protein
MGVMAMVNDVSVNVFVLAHACDAVSAADPLNVPADDADQSVMCDSVSDVLTFVHGPTDADAAFEPPEAAAIVACLRVVSPAVAPAAPGSAVCSFTQHVAVANVPSSQPFTTELARPVATMNLLWMV